MKKRLAYLIILLIFVTSTLLTGCDDAPQTPYIPNNNPGTPNSTHSHAPDTGSSAAIESTEPDDGRAIPFSKMKEDMSAREEMQNFYTSDFVTESAYVVTGLVLEKEQVSSDGKQTTSYSNIIAKNEYFEANLRVRSVYNLYDYGGWIMDEFSIEQIHTISPLRVPNEDSVTDYLKNYVSYSASKYGPPTYLHSEDNFTLKSTELVENYARLYFFVENSVMKLNCYIEFEYGEDGWKNTECYTESVQFDYSAALGRFKGEVDMAAGAYSLEGDGSIQIVSITGDKAIIDVYYCKSDIDGRISELVTGKGIECEFYPGSGKIQAPTTEGWTESLSYDPHTDTWKSMIITFTRTEN